MSLKYFNFIWNPEDVYNELCTMNIMQNWKDILKVAYSLYESFYDPIFSIFHMNGPQINRNMNYDALLEFQE